MDDYIYSDETYKIIGACFEVYNEIGCGFLEPVYHDCLAVELQLQGIPFESQKSIKVEYKGRPIDREYIPDFICYNEIIVEIKAVSKLTEEHYAQIINYLNLAEIEVGLLINFGSYPNLEHKRFSIDIHR